MGVSPPRRWRRLCRRCFNDYGFSDHEAATLNGSVPGFVIDRLMSPRDALQPLELAYFFDSIESGGRIVFRHRGAEGPVLSLTADDLVEERSDDALLTMTRAQETDLPASAKINYIAGAADYRQAVAEARRLAGASGRVSQADLPLVLEHERASEIAESWLFEAWASRERAAFKLPPSALALEPGDTVSVSVGGETRLLRVTDVGEHGVREIEARAVDPEVYGGVVSVSRTGVSGDVPLAGRPVVEFFDLPLLRGDEPPEAGYVAAFQSPWPGGVAVYSSPETSGYALRALADSPAIMGEDARCARRRDDRLWSRGDVFASRLPAVSLLPYRGCSCSPGVTWRRCVTRPVSGRCCNSRRRRWWRRRSTSFRDCCAGRVAPRRRWLRRCRPARRSCCFPAALRA